MNTRPEIDLYLKYYSRQHEDLWVLTLEYADKNPRERDVLIISNVDIRENSDSISYYFAVPRVKKSLYPVVYSDEEEFKVNFKVKDRALFLVVLGRLEKNKNKLNNKSNDKSNDESNRDKVLEVFDRKQPDFQLLSPGMQDIMLCEKWIRKHTKYATSDYVILEVGLNI